jgi:hypothetical protein
MMNTILRLLCITAILAAVMCGLLHVAVYFDQMNYVTGLASGVFLTLLAALLLKVDRQTLITAAEVAGAINLID